MTTATESGTPAADDSADSLAVPIRKTMLEKFLMVGIDRKLTAAELAIIVFTAIGLRNPWVLLALPPTHLILWLATKKDPDQFNCYLRYSKQGDFYEPRPMLRQTRNARPKGFARGELC